MAPEGTPPEIVQRLNAEMRKVLASAEVKDRLARQGVEPQASTPQQLHDRIRSEIERWRKVVKDADIKIEE
jgi:tripartite-type tricarboxylate transporter receptor subunit TctC